MRISSGFVLLAVVLALGACSPGTEASDAPIPSDEAPSDQSPASAVQDVMQIEHFAPLEPGTYFIDPDLEPSTPLRVVYEILAEGWEQWIGAAKFSDLGTSG